MKRECAFFLKDILDAIRCINEFIGDMGYEEFLADLKTRSAVILQVQIIGEATKNIPQEVRQLNGRIPWRAMAALRDKVTHFYFGVDYMIVWGVVKKDLPALEPEVKELLAQINLQGPQTP